MTSHQLAEIVVRMAELSRMPFNYLQLRESISDTQSFNTDEIELMVGALIQKAQLVGMIPVRHAVPRASLPQLLSEAEYPVLAFRTDEGLVPVLFYHDKRNRLHALEFTEGGQTGLQDPKVVFDKLHTEDGDKVVMLAAFPLRSLVSDDEAPPQKPMTPVRRLFHLLKVEKRDIYIIYVYAIAMGFINLSLPLGIQAIIGMISGGMVFNTVVVLIVLVVIGVLIAGGLQIMQITMVEMLQRRVYARAAFEFAYRIPRFRTEALTKFYPPELINRFFDVLTIQKGLPKILIDITQAVLQIVFGLILLSFYNSFFVFFGILIVTAVFLLFYLTGPKGLSTGLKESKYKYKTVYWLEEMARTVQTFKLAGRSHLAVERTDALVNGYLDFRRQHFRVLMTQYVYLIIFKTVIIATLLAFGTFLVVDRQITLGQFVASELIIVLVIGSIEKIILNIDVIYDTLVGVEKVGNVTDVGLERAGGLRFPAKAGGVAIAAHDLRYQHAGKRRPALQGISLEISPGESICLSGPNESGKGTLVQILAGLREDYQGGFRMDGMSLRDVMLEDLRDQVSDYISQEELFEGTLLENLTLGKRHIGHEEIGTALDMVGLGNAIAALPEGLQTHIEAGGHQFSDAFINRFMVARCIASRPRLLILNDYLQYLDKREKLRLAQYLTDPERPWTFVTVSNDPVFQNACDRVVVMREGKVLAQGTYESLRENADAWEVLQNI